MMLSAHYREKRDASLVGMERHFSGGPKAPPGVRWNRPEGGFFVTVHVPFEFTMSLAEECAATAGVIIAPMSLFAFSTAHYRAIRLSFSAVALEDIDEGVARLASFVRGRQAKSGRAAATRAASIHLRPASAHSDVEASM